MRSFITVIVGLALTAALWTSRPPAVFADGHDDVNSPQSKCEPGPPPAFVPGRSLGPVAIGMPLDAVQHWLGRPQLVENRDFQGHRWTHMLVNGIDVLGRDNTVVALNLPRVRPIPIQWCDTVVARPFNLPVGYLQQTYGVPTWAGVLNGLQYWLYNHLGLLVTAPVGANYVQGLTVYPAGQYCTVVPALVNFGRGAINAGGTTAQCPVVERESH
jgi:hypothetical protein